MAPGSLSGIGTRHPLHDLRHTGNHLTATSGANLSELMARMGHSSTRAALIYLHSTDGRQREIAKALNQLAKNQLKRAKHNGSGEPIGHTAGTSAERCLVKIIG